MTLEELSTTIQALSRKLDSLSTKIESVTKSNAHISAELQRLRLKLTNFTGGKE